MLETKRPGCVLHGSPGDNHRKKEKRKEKRNAAYVHGSQSTAEKKRECTECNNAIHPI
jgi:hypothetical protein